METVIINSYNINLFLRTSLIIYVIFINDNVEASYLSTIVFDYTNINLYDFN
jgi:hypothetical protein